MRDGRQTHLWGRFGGRRSPFVGRYCQKDVWRVTVARCGGAGAAIEFPVILTAVCCLENAHFLLRGVFYRDAIVLASASKVQQAAVARCGEIMGVEWM